MQNPTDQATGLWFKEQTVDSLIAAEKRFESLRAPISPLVCRRNAEKFSAERFCQELYGLVQRRWTEFQALPGRCPWRQAVKRAFGRSSALQ